MHSSLKNINICPTRPPCPTSCSLQVNSACPSPSVRALSSLGASPPFPPLFSTSVIRLSLGSSRGFAPDRSRRNQEVICSFGPLIGLVCSGREASPTKLMNALPQLAVILLILLSPSSIFHPLPMLYPQPSLYCNS